MKYFFLISYQNTRTTKYHCVPPGLQRRVPGHISLDDDCGVPRNRDESSGVANLIILTEHSTKMHLYSIISGDFFFVCLDTFIDG